MNPSVTEHLIIVNQQHPDASDQNPGTEAQPLRTIQAAAERAYPGDTILVHTGLYRETVCPPRGGETGLPITYQAAPGESVTIKGSEVYQGEWQPAGKPHVYAADISLPPDAENPFAIPLVEKGQTYIEQMGSAVTRRTLGQVFLDGQMLDEVDRLEHLEQMPGTWLAVEGGRKVMVHFPAGVLAPSEHTVELTLRKAVFRPEQRGLGYLVIRGFVLEHAANQALTSFWEKGFAPQQGLVSCRSGHHWRIEENIIRYAKSIGLDIGSEGRMDELDNQPTPGLVGYHHIVGNTISDNGQGGICGLGHIGTEIVGNIFERNNNLGATAWEEAAIKTHFYLRGRIEGNLIRDNHCNGIWLDNVYQDIRVTRNIILNNQGAGIFCEMGGGPCLIDHNIIGLQARCNGEIGGNGIYAHDAGGVTIVHNWLGQNASFGVSMRIAVERNYAVYPPDITSFNQPPSGEAPCHCRNNHIANNIFVDNQRGAVDLPYPAEKAGQNTCERNLYAGNSAASAAAALFAANTTGGATMEQIIAALQEAAQAEAGNPLPAGGLFIAAGEQVLLGREAWQALMNTDRESRSAIINNIHWQMIHPGPGPWLTFRLEADSLPACDRVAGAGPDFLGQRLPESFPAPGPFQALRPGGAYHIRLWPGPGD